MKRMAIILSVLILTAVVLPACGGGSSSTPTDGQPRIYFDQDFVDLGKVPQGISLDYTFHFSNVGDAPLIIEDVSARALEGCCPNDPVVGTATLQPGDEGTLQIGAPSVEEMGMSGLHLFEIKVKSNDPVEPVKKLQLRADFEPME